MAERLAGHERREAIEQATDGGGRCPHGPPAQDQVGDRGRQRHAQDQQAICLFHRGDEAGQRDHEKSEQGAGRVLEQIDAVGRKDRVTEERVLPVEQGVGNPGHEPDRLAEVGVDPEESVGREPRQHRPERHEPEDDIGDDGER